MTPYYIIALDDCAPAHTMRVAADDVTVAQEEAAKLQNAMPHCAVIITKEI